MLLLVLLLLLLTPPLAAEPPPFCATKLGQFAVHASNSPRWGTPLVSGPDGAAYVCYITPDMQTVVRRYEPTTRAWSTPTVLDAQTINDPFHTQCSLGMDVQGLVHAAYNMHNTPWQYAVSAQPHDVSTMVFRGQYAGEPPSTGTPKGNCTGACADAFMQNEPGIAALPGNQITYPTFGTTQDGTLFLVARECLLCDQSFHDRQWSLGLWRYIPGTQTWVRAAGIRPFATAPGKLAVGASLYGDQMGRLHLSVLWCNAYNEAEGSEGCFAHENFVTYLSSSDKGDTWKTSGGKVLPLPLVPDRSEVASGPEWFTTAKAAGFYDGNTSLTIDTKGVPTIVVFPLVTDTEKNIKRGYVTRPGADWTKPPRILGYSPSLTYTDRAGRLIAVSSGMRIQVGDTLYPLAMEEGTYSLALDRSWLQRTGQLRLYANNQNTGKLFIWSLTFPESGVCQ